MMIRPYLNRTVRGIAYFALAFVLLSVNTWGTENHLKIAAAISLLGLMTDSARIGQVGLLILTVMAVVPLPTITGLLG